MIARLAVLACAVLCGNAAIAATEYGVDELGVGVQLKFDSASYREFSSNPSEQFEVLTWCQKTRHDLVLPTQQPRAIQLTGDLATSPEAQERAGDQTLQTIQSESASGATHIVRVEKPQPADGTTRIEATPATGAEISNHDTEDDRVGEPTDAHAVIPPSDAEPAAADAKSSRWEKSNWWEARLWLNCRLAAPVGSLQSEAQNWMRETARKHRPLDAWSGADRASPEPRVGDGEATPRALYRRQPSLGSRQFDDLWSRGHVSREAFAGPANGCSGGIGEQRGGGWDMQLSTQWPCGTKEEGADLPT